MLDRLALRVENSRLQVYVNFGFHLATCSELIKHCLKSSYWNNISRSKKRPEEKLIMQNPPPVQASKSSTGLDENVAALLSYIFGWVSGLIFFLIEKDSRLVRFHAMQSILFNALIAVVGIVLWIVTVVVLLVGTQLPGIMGGLLSLISTLFWLVFSVGLLIAFILCLVKAFQGQYWKLPVVGNFAEKFSTK